MMLGLGLAITGGGVTIPFDHLIASDADVATVNAASLSDGARIGVARGSVLTTQLTIVADRVLVEAYGSGAKPEFRCDDLLSSGGWTKTGGLTNVYERTIALPGDVKIMGNVWEDEGFMSLVTSTALCDATAGTAYVSDWTAASATLYIHATGNGDPASNGKAYRYSARASGIVCTGDGVTVNGILTRRNGHQDGSLRLSGEDCIVNNCRVEDGCRHAAYFGANVRISNSYFYRARNDLEGSANLVVINQPAVVGLNAFTTSNNTFDAGDQTACTGLDAHGSVTSDLFATASSTGDTFDGLTLGLASAASACTVTNPVCAGISQLVSLTPSGSVCTVTGATGTCNRLYEELAAGCTFTSRGNTLTVSALAAGFYKSEVTTANHTLTVDGDNITVLSEAVVANPSELLRVARGTVTFKNTTVGPALAPPIDVLIRAGYSSQTVTLVSQNNTYPRGSLWIVNTTTYRSVAEIQTATLDTGSAFATMPAASFSDDFNRANENLEASANWTRTGGAAAQAAIRSNNLSFIGTTQTLYSAPALSSPDHWVRGTVRGVLATAGPFALIVRGLDASNWIGARWASGTGAYTVGRDVAATISAAIGSTTVVTPATGDDVILAVRGTVFTLIVNDKALVVNSLIGDSGALAANVLAGTLPRSTALDPAFDNFSCGAL